MSKLRRRTLWIRISGLLVGSIIASAFWVTYYEVKQSEAALKPAPVIEKRNDMYEYQAKVIRVVDADTLWCRVDLGFRITRDIALRLEGINAPELSTPEGKTARDRLKEVLFVDADIVVRTYRDPGAYDRYTAKVYFNGTNINDWLISEGLAVPYIYKR